MTSKTFDLGDFLKNICGMALLTSPDHVRCQVDSSLENPFLNFSFDFRRQTDDTLEYVISVRNISGAPLTIHALAPGYVDASGGTGAMNLGGSLTEWTQFIGGLSRGVTDLCEACYTRRTMDFYAKNYALYGNRKTGKYLLCGFTSFSRFATSIELHAVEPGFRFSSLRAVCCVGKRTLAPGETLTAEALTLRIGGNPGLLMDAYFDQLAAVYGHRSFHDVVGWATWDCYQRGVTEADVLENLAWLKAHRATLPVTYIQLDDGFEIREGDWLLANGKFPSGLRALAQNVREAGFLPGLWLCPFLAAPESEVVRQHPDWILHDAAGAPFLANGYAVPEVYVLDCSVPGVNEWLRELARIVTEDYGFAYIKLDGGNAQGLSPLAIPARPGVSSVEAMRSGLEAFCSGLKAGTFLLNTACMFGTTLGLADAVRIGDDVGARWDASKIAKDHGERDRFNGPGEILRSIAASGNHSVQHKRLWVNDPDYLVVRQEGCNSELSYEEARSWATAVSMSNGLIMLSDPMKKLATARIALLEKVLPHSPHPARAVDFFRKETPSLLAMPAENDTEAWLVASAINTDIPKRVRDYELSFDDLGLKTGLDYLVFDFWNAEFRGVARDSFTVHGLAPHDCRVLSFREKTGGVQLLGTNVHISMGAVELSGWTFSGNTLRVRTKDMGRCGRIYVYSPCGFPRSGNTVADRVFSVEIPFDGSVAIIPFMD